MIDLQTCTVRFYSNCNEKTDLQSIKKGACLDKLPIPTREGHRFLGWYRKGEPFSCGTPVTEDCTLVAHWQRSNESYPASNIAIPTFEGIGAKLHTVWKDYANEKSLRPHAVTCILTQSFGSTKRSFEITLTQENACWKNTECYPEGAVLTQGEGGDWTLAIKGLPQSVESLPCSYTLRQEPLTGTYQTLQSGAAAINSLVGYEPKRDKSAWLTTRNRRLYDAAGNMIVLRGVVTLNVGISGLVESTTVEALQRLAQTGCNAIRLTAQLIGRASGEGYVYYNNGSGRTYAYNDENATRMSESDRALMLAHIDTVIQNATEVGLYSVIDWGILTSNPNQYLSEACEFFSRLAARYRENPYVIFEICNEPKATWGRANGEENSIKAYAERVIDIIRAENTEALIILAPNNCATALSVYSAKPTAGDDPIDDPLDDERRRNVAYTFHCYPYNYAYNTYSWKLRDAYEAGLTVITTEMSPMDGTFDAPDKLTYDMEEAEKFLRMYREWDMSLFYFRYAASEDGYNENLMFPPTVDLTRHDWTRDDLTACGKWFYDLVTGDGMIANTPDYTRARKKDYRPSYNETHAEFGLGNVFPGFANAAVQEDDAYFYRVSREDILTDLQYENYCSLLCNRVADATGQEMAQTPPTSKTEPLKITYTYAEKHLMLTLTYGKNRKSGDFGLTLAIQ